MSGETTRSSAAAPRPTHALLLALGAVFWLHGTERAVILPGGLRDAYGETNGEAFS